VPQTTSLSGTMVARVLKYTLSWCDESREQFCVVHVMAYSGLAVKDRTLLSSRCHPEMAIFENATYVLGKTRSAYG